MTDYQLGTYQRHLPVALPGDLPNISGKSDLGKPEIYAKTQGIVAGLGMEALTLPPETQKVIGIERGPLQYINLNHPVFKDPSGWVKTWNGAWPSTQAKQEWVAGAYANPDVKGLWLDPKEAWTWCRRQELGKLQTWKQFKKFTNRKTGSVDGVPVPDNSEMIQRLLTPAALRAFQHDMCLAYREEKKELVWRGLSTDDQVTFKRAGISEGDLRSLMPAQPQPIRKLQLPASPPQGVRTSDRLWLSLHLEAAHKPQGSWGEKRQAKRSRKETVQQLKQSREPAQTPEQRAAYTAWEMPNLVDLTSWKAMTQFFDHQGSTGFDRGWKVRNYLTQPAKRALRHDMVRLVLDETGHTEWRSLDTTRYTRYLVMAGVTPNLYETYRTQQ